MGFEPFLTEDSGLTHWRYWNIIATWCLMGWLVYLCGLLDVLSLPGLVGITKNNIRHKPLILGIPIYQAVLRWDYGILEYFRCFNWRSLWSILRIFWWPQVRNTQWRYNGDMEYPLVMTGVANWNITMLLMGKITISMATFNSFL